MPRKRRTIYSANTCRICLNNDGLLSDIFVGNIQEKISDFAKSISINGNYDKELPKKICHICLYKLEMWNELKGQFIQTNQVFLEHLETSELSDNFSLPAKKRLLMNQEHKDSSPGLSEPITPFETIFLSANNENNDDTAASKDAKKPDPDKKVHSPMKTRFSGSRMTSGQRLASTRRWVARKKARLAATGSQETESDTESQISESSYTMNRKMSPKMKSEKFFKRIKNHKLLDVNYDDMSTDLNETETNPNPPEKNPNPVKDEPKDENTNNIKKQPEIEKDNTALPTLQSELRVFGSVFLLNMTLISSDDKKPLNNNNNTKVDPRENTDIIDAVQLKRVSFSKSDNSLQHQVQKELEAIIESNLKRDMLRKSLREELRMHDGRPSVESQVKLAVENAVKTLESSKSLSSRFPAALTQAALKSSVFQPKVVLNRLDVAKPKEPSFQIENDLMMETIEVKKEKEVKKYERKLPEDRKPPSILKKPIQKAKKTLRTFDRYPCDKCPFIFQNKEQYDAHHAASHVEKPPVPPRAKLMRCKRCHEIVEARLVKSHVCKSKIFHRCVICNSAFRSLSLLQQHKITHEQAKKEKIGLFKNFKNSCFVCDKLFPSIDVLNKHLQEHCDGICDEEEDKAKKTPIQQIQCDQCWESFGNQAEFERHHSERHTSVDKVDRVDKSEVVLTSTIDEIFNEEGKENSNEEDGDGLACFLCEKVFGTLDQLQEHVAKH